MIMGGGSGGDDWMVIQARESLACAGGAAEAKASILDLKVEAIPELWPERFRKSEPQWSPTTKSGRSAVGL